MKWIYGKRRLVKKAIKRAIKRARGGLYWRRLKYLYGGLERDPEVGDLVRGHDGLNHVITNVNVYMVPVHAKWDSGPVVGHRVSVEAYYGPDGQTCATDA